MPESAPFVYWVGINTPADADAASLAEFNAFYNTTHMGEVVARHGFARGTRFELLESDAHGRVGPRWLCVYEMGDEAAARGYIQRNGGPPPGRPPYTSGPPIWKQSQIAWRVIWRPLSTTGTAAQPPHSIYTVGMNVPAGTEAPGLDKFNTFYTGVHVPEVVDWGGFGRATRFERYRAFRYPELGCPQFCAVYEADEGATNSRRERRRPAFSPGPPEWEGHETHWRLWYRRLEMRA
jgi:hypothetical protein